MSNETFTMQNLEALLEPIRHSPRLLEAVELLNRQVQNEQQRRQRFYQEMTEEQKVEFIDGDVVLHSPARNRHLDATGFLVRLLSTFVDIHKLGTVRSEKCLCVFPRNDYEPDIVFFGPEKAATLKPDTLKFPVPDFIVEVLSDSTEARARGVKLEDYAANGVREYWIIDSEHGAVEQRLLRDGDYELLMKSSSGTLKSQVIEGFAIPVEAVFDEAANLETLKSLLS
ncbi:MAG: Uma2 family endonuclease [Planctomycetaceae bacterium]